QDRLVAAQDDYEELKKRLAAQAAREAAREAAAASAAPSAPSVSAPSAPIVVPSGNMTCPVAGPNSFIDSWGYPRSGGRTHEGTDIMAAEGTPVVAITNGTITYSGYGSSAGNWLVLSGRDGHGYWYMHNRENLVTGGSVQVGQQIATVGNTGNASGGAPHVHFEYHPGGGGPVNPYSLLRGLC
ncbi:MAG: M23 family metallopeptidase, partial [Actinomycetota bacterium]